MPLDLAAGNLKNAGQFEVSKTVLEADLVINLAMERIGAASAAANLFKVLKSQNYLGQKYLSSEAEIFAGLEPVLDKTITIGEAEFVQRSNKLTTFMGLVLAGKSARNVDRIFNEVAQSFKVAGNHKKYCGRNRAGGRAGRLRRCSTKPKYFKKMSKFPISKCQNKFQNVRIFNFIILAFIGNWKFWN